MEVAATAAADLAVIAYTHATLRAQVAGHPNTYPGLLEWLETYGGPQVAAAVAARRDRDAAPPASHEPKDDEPAAPVGATIDGPEPESGASGEVVLVEEPPGAQVSADVTPAPEPEPGAPRAAPEVAAPGPVVAPSVAAGDLSAPGPVDAHSSLGPAEGQAPPTPLVAPTEGTAPPAPMGVTGQPSGPPPKRSRTPVVVMAAALVVVLVLGVTVFALRDRLFGGESSSGPTGLTVHGPEFAPVARSTLVISGIKEEWSYPEATTVFVDPSVVVVEKTQPDGLALVGLEPDTGKERWTQEFSGEPGSLSCAAGVWQAQVVCKHLYMPWTAVLYDTGTGKESPADASTAGWDVIDVFVSGDSLYTVARDPSGAAEELSRWDSRGRPVWTVPQESRDCVGDLWRTVWEVRDDLLTYCSTVYDKGDGRRLTSPGLEGDCFIPVLFGGNRLVCRMVSGETWSDTLDLSGGRTATRFVVGDDGFPLSLAGDAPNSFVVWDDNTEGSDLDRVTLRQFDSDRQVARTVELPYQYRATVAAAWDGADRFVVVGADSGVALVDMGAENFVWESNPGLEVIIDSEGWLVQSASVGFVDEGTIWVASPAGSWLIDVASGEATPTSYRVAGPGARDQGSVVASADNTVALLVPDPDTGQQEGKVPEGLGPCPSGMQIVGGSRYPGGLVLVCGSGTDFQVTARHQGKELAATDLTFAAWGWTVTCKDGTVLAVGLGGGLVSTAGGTWAATGWSASTGPVGFAQVAVKPCVANTVPLSLSTWDGGWFLVCGTDLKTPTFAAWEDGTVGPGESTDVKPDAMGYCLRKGRVCAHPGEVVLSEGDDPAQRSVGADWFVGRGPGG